ncbi:ABC-2 type transport system permease protein OS=Ureibacillus acetophenoni OX=614649 GN=SAMN05877842_103175 PE=4 SV=1 [Ureibacillus acetophenoni]
MWKLLKTNLVIEKSSKKNIFAFIFIALFIFGLALYMENEDVGNLAAQKTSEQQNVLSALSQYPDMDASPNGDSSEIYKNLNEQQRLIALQRIAANLNKPDLFADSAIDLSNAREKAFLDADYGDVAEFLPTYNENKLETIFYERLISLDIPIFTDNLTYYQFLIFLFGILGSVWFIFVAFYTCGIMIDDFKHTSLIKGYPISFDKYVAAKGISTMSIILVFILEIFLCSLPLIYFRGLGDPNYPVAVFDGNYEIYSITKYIGISVLYMIFIAIFVILLSIILNVLLKNMYLTLFVEMFLFALPLLFPRLVSLIPFNPFNYINFTDLLDGKSLELAHPVGLNSTHGLIYIGISIVILIVIANVFLSTGKLKRV